MHQPELSIKVGEREYIFSPLNLNDAEKLTTACKFYGYHCAKNAGLTQDELDKALNRCVEYSPTEDQIQNFLSVPAGQVETLFLSLIKKQPEFTRAAVKDMMAIMTMDTAVSIMTFLQKAGHPDPETGPEKSGN